MNILVWLAVPLAILAVAALAVWKLLRSRNMELWIGNYLRRPRMRAVDGPVHVMFCFVDHFEPMWHGGDLAAQRRRVIFYRLPLNLGVALTHRLLNTIAFAYGHRLVGQSSQAFLGFCATDRCAHDQDRGHLDIRP